MKVLGSTNGTHGVQNCNVGGFTSLSKRLISLFHLLPGQPGRPLDLEKIRTELLRDIREMQADGDILYGFLTGGWASSAEDALIQSSQQLGEWLTEIIQQAGVRLSRIWGRNPWYSVAPIKVFCDAKEDAWYLYSPEKCQVGIAASRAGLERCFKIVDIAPGDQLITPEHPDYETHFEKI